MMRIPQKMQLYLMPGPMNLRTDMFTQDSGRTEIDMEKENNTGMMADYMKVTGGTVRDIKREIVCLF